MSDLGSSRKPVTASELVERLGNDPRFIARRDEADSRRQQVVEQNARAAAPVVLDLQAAGLSFGSIGEMRRSGTRYVVAIPVLLKWLPAVENHDVKESIVRALSVPWARPVAAAPLIAEFRKAPGPESGLKWAIGNALSVVADDSVFDDLAALVRDRRHGKAREMLAVAIGNMRDPRAVDLAIELLGDDEVAGHALMAIGKLGARKARPVVEPFLNHPKAWIRAKARRVLARLDR